MLSLEETEKIKNRIVLSQITRTSSHKENPENVMDLKSGSTIIGKPERPPRMFRKEGTQPSRRDGKKTQHIEKLNGKNGWTLDCCIFLDNFKTVKFDYKAT